MFVDVNPIEERDETINGLARLTVVSFASLARRVRAPRITFAADEEQTLPAR